ncbi:esterase-like activity of phytase family protein [Thermatribacter velox]|uniref:esterase-like activity of phytase family protein n=1 Tax=Thermatribacter velox TaxID=3039681 RepID=UPI0034D98020
MSPWKKNRRFSYSEIEIVETISLKHKEGKSITGLPITPGLIGATNEIALTENLQIIGYSNDGLDPEGIALDHEGNFWICDEYGPFVAKFDKKGKLLKEYATGNGLPEVLKYRIPNRGFEGITVAPNGKIYIAVQSVLNIEEKTAVTAQFTRIVELDPLTGKTRMYAYPIDRENYNSPKDAKIGDIFAISNDKLLLIEQGKDKEKKMRNIIYLVELQGATDISNLKIDGKEPEFITDKNKLSTIKFASKTMIIDLRTNGWKAEKAEGIAMLPDGKTIVVASDNDFGITIDVQDSENQDTEILDYTLYPDGSLKHNNKVAKPVFRIVPNPDAVESNTQLWLIKLPETLK